MPTGPPDSNLSSSSSKYARIDPRRLQALRRYDIIDTPPEETFDRIADLAAALLDVPIGLVTFVGDQKQWHKACIGLDAQELGLDSSFCVHTLDEGQRLVVEDATEDERFDDNPLVTEDPHVRFYAGAPMITPDGHVLGTVCVLDTKPRAPSERQLTGLDDLAQMGVDQLERRRRQKISAVEQGGADSDETRLNELLASLDDAVWEVRIHPTGSSEAEPVRRELAYVNSSEEHIFGRPTDAFVRDPMLWRSAAHPKDQPELPTARDLLEHGRWRGEYRVLRPDGTARWVETSVRVVGRASFSSQDGSSQDERTLDAPVKLAGVTRSIHRRKQAEASAQEKSTALAEEKTRLRVALDAADAGVFEWSVPEDQRVWDERTQALFGVDAAPQTTGALLGHVHPGDRGRLQDTMARVLGTPDKETCQVRYRIRRPDGEDRHVQARARILRDEDGDAERLIGTYQDVTERRRRRQKLRRSERQFEAVFQDPNLLTGLLDLDGTLRRVNDAALSFIGADRTDVVGRPFWETPWWDHDSALQADLQGWIERAAAGEYVTYQSQHVTGNGLTFTVRGSIRPVTGEDGTVTALIVSGRDVTAREDQRRELEVLHQAVEDSAEGMAVLAGDEYVYVDQTHAHMYGFDDKEQLLGNTWRMLYGEDEIERLEKTVFPVLEEEGHWQGLVTGQRPDGSTFPAALSLTVTEAGRLVCTVRDMTDRRNRNRKRQLLLTASETGIAEWDLQAGQIRWDGMLRNIFGRAPESTDDFFALIHPEDRSRVRDGFDSVVDSASSWNGEFRIEDGDGRTRWIETLVIPIFEDGEVGRLLASGTDVTERKERQRKLDLALAGTDTGVLEWNLQTGEMQWDETLQDLFGHDPQTFEAFTEIVHPNDLPDVEAALENMTSTGESWEGDFWLFHPEEGVARMSLRATPVHEKGEAVRVLGIATDVTAQWERQRDLATSRERYQTLLQANPDPVLVADAETGKIVEANAAATGLLGRPREEIIGAHQTDLHPSGRAEAYASLFRRSLDEDGPMRALPDGTQIEVVTDEGTTVPVEVNATTVDLPDGRVVYGVFRDVSERKAMQKRLTRRERRFRMMFEGHSAPMLLIDEETGAIEQANAAAVEFYGYERDILMSMSIQDINQLPAEEVARERREAAEDGDEFLFEHELASGAVRTVRVLSAPIPNLDRAGTLLFSVIHDVTQREEHRQDLADQKAFLDQVLDTIDDVFYLLDEQGDLLFWNRRVNEVTGYTDAELEAMTALDLFEGDDAARIRDAIEESTAGQAVRVEAPLVTKDGRRVPHEFVGDAFDAPTRGRVLCGIGRDVTQQKERRRALRRANQRFEQLAEAVPNAFYIVTPDYSELLYANSAAETLYGVDRDTLRDDPSAWTRHVHPADLASLRSDIEAQNADEPRWPQHQEFRVLHPTRGRRWLAARIDPIYDDEGTLQRLAGVTTDVTDQKVREQRLRTLYRVTRDLLDVSTKAGAASTVTDALGDTLGLREAAVYLRDGDVLVRAGTIDSEVVGSMPRVEQGHTPLWAALDEGDTHAYSDPSTIDDGVDRSGLAGCAYVPLGQRGVLVVGAAAQNRLDDDELRLLEVVAQSFQDTLDALDQERDLIERERRYRTLAENIPNGAVFLFDEGLTYTLAAGELLGTYELGESDLLGAQAGTVLVGIGGGRHPIVDRFEAALEGERTDRRIGVGGRTLRVHVVPLQGDTEAEGLMLAQDITENVRKERELMSAKKAAEEANRMKSSLLANMSHEIRTPLTSILGFAEMIEEETGSLEPPAEAGDLKPLGEFAGLIQKSGQRLMDTLTGVLNLSRLEAGEMDLAAEPVDLSEQAREVAGELRPRAEAEGLRLQVQAGGEPIWAQADGGGVQIVLRNLVSNAIKYTDDGELWLRVYRENGSAMIEVEDSGIGMDPEKIEDLFKPFRQASEGMAREYEGTGLGLAVTREAVEQMNGSIEVETEKGKGTTIRVQLPKEESRETDNGDVDDAEC
ncbi:PAS domain S-box protein [Salinibacter ruber]|uniref:PAS domain S-box protein n=1 Tax=Salinibacter ruber TaxID=146919 RepID=UPI000E57AD1B|nr:PAS domain S-box protein [Salinibacter ruber]